MNGITYFAILGRYLEISSNNKQHAYNFLEIVPVIDPKNQPPKSAGVGLYALLQDHNRLRYVLLALDLIPHNLHAAT